MSSMIPVFDFAQFQELMMEPNWADVNPGLPAIAVHLPREPGTTGEVVQIENWLSRQPIPVIGVVHEADKSSLEDTVDLIVSDDDQLSAVVEKIIRNPRASSVLVQVVRTTVSLPVAQALNVESLAYSTLQGGQEFARWLHEFQSRRGAKTPPQIIDFPIKISRKGNQLEIILNTPENRNALSVPMRDALSDAFKMVIMDRSIEHVDVYGNGPSFSAGGDLTEFGDSSDRALAHQIRLLRMPAQYLAQEAGRYTFHLHGACIGAGIEMPAFAGRLKASPDTFFHLPEVGMGLVPGAGGCVSIPRRIGRQKLNWLAITGQRLPADKALEWGLIDEITL
ncbi:MAG: enoyl-CoA hydratase/isomerase family protein [Gammaproteobacteria bacterium]|nr:enoyl-CoA hydratase/isomerase family protein [Gammaproteobacteria bacterium]